MQAVQVLAESCRGSHDGSDGHDLDIFNGHPGSPRNHLLVASPAMSGSPRNRSADGRGTVSWL